MENQTRYDLNAAIEGWRLELAAQPNLTPEVRRELETHLRDAIVGFQQRGLSDAEAFCLARHRVGQPERLGKEFVKAEPGEIWRERGLWVAATLLMLSLWNGSVSAISHVMIPKGFSGLELIDILHGQISYSYIFGSTINSLLRNLLLFVAGVFILKGDNRLFLWFEKLLYSRKRFLTITGVWFGLNEVVMGFAWPYPLDHWNPFSRMPQLIWVNAALNLTWPLALIVFIAWLLSPQKIKDASLLSEG